MSFTIKEVNEWFNNVGSLGSGENYWHEFVKDFSLEDPNLCVCHEGELQKAREKFNIQKKVIDNLATKLNTVKQGNTNLCCEKKINIIIFYK